MSGVLLETVLFFTLLALVSIQVGVYWTCTQDSDDLPSETILSYDEAWLNVTIQHIAAPQQAHKHEPPYFILRVSENCYKCSYTVLSNITANRTATFKMDTTFPLILRLENEESECLCANMTHHFTEGSQSNLVVTHNASAPRDEVECTLQMGEKGDNAFLPILYAAVAIVVLSVGWVMLSFIYRFLKEKGYFKLLHFHWIDRLTHRDLGFPDAAAKKYRSVGSASEGHPILNTSTNSSLVVSENTRNGPLLSANHVEEKQGQKRRLTSLDSFRGMSLTIMIFVNYGGGGYWFFDHSKWNGLTVADLVFPWFIWIMGVSLVFSFHGRRKDGFLKQLFQVIRRTIILFAVGLFLNTSEDTSLYNLRIPGVLQRFSITYLVVALTELFASRLYRWKDLSLWDPIKDITSNSVELAMAGTLELLWLLLTFLMPVHGCPRGYLGPGGIAENGSYQNCTGGAAGAIDRWVLGGEHLYDEATAKDLYQLTLNYDPEGILGSLNSIVLCYLGVQAGKTLLYFRGKHWKIAARFIIWGFSLSIAGTVLCLGQKNEGWIPLNKNLWSLSFILVMAGTGYLVLAVFYLTIDAARLWNGSPFRYPGMNSIIVYVGHELLGSFFPFAVYNQEKSHMTYLAANLVAVGIWLLISYYWFSLKFFVKI